MVDGILVWKCIYPTCRVEIHWPDRNNFPMWVEAHREYYCDPLRVVLGETCPWMKNLWSDKVKSWQGGISFE